MAIFSFVTFHHTQARRTKSTEVMLSDTSGTQEVTDSHNYSITVNEAYASNIHVTPNQSYSISTAPSADADHTYTELLNELISNEFEYDYVN